MESIWLYSEPNFPFVRIISKMANFGAVHLQLSVMYHRKLNYKNWKTILYTKIAVFNYFYIPF